MYGQELSVDQIVESVKRAGFKKTGSTVRHHLKILGDTCMVDVAKIVESCSGVTKYYGTSTRLLNFEEPENFESNYAEIIDDVARRLEETIRNLHACISKRGGRPGI